MNDAEYEELQEYRRQDLLSHMKSISEEQWASGWKAGLEHDLYLMTFHGLVARYGRGDIEPARLERMKQLAQLCQCWWIHADGQRRPTTIALSEAERRFSKLVALDAKGVEHELSIADVKQRYEQAAPSDWESETISSPLKGLPDWQLFRLRPEPLIVLMSSVEEDEELWELRFGDTTVDVVKPAWAKRR